MSRTDEELWIAWCGDFEEVEREVFSLFHTRWMWRAITGLMNNGVPGRQYAVVQNYFVRTYVGTVCTAIRREADRSAQTSSLARCLNALAESPHLATRSRYVAMAQARCAEVGSDNTGVEIEAAFDQFAPTGGEFIDAQIPKDALRRLIEAAQPIRKYTNKVLAHRERDGDVEKLTPTWDEINAALDEVGRVVKQFYGLRHPSEELWNLTPVVGLEFASMFRVPWYTEAWRPPEVRDNL